MSAAGVSSLFLQSHWAVGVVHWIGGFDPQLLATLPPGEPRVALVSSDPHAFAWLMIITTTITTVVWVAVTFLTQPEPEAKLREFYLRVLPAAVGWGPIARACGEQASPRQSLLWSAADWVAGCTMIYATLFGIGQAVFEQWAAGVMLLLIASACAGFIFWDLSRRGWETLSS